jgi:AcrR family transcriptional regulator
LDMKSKRAYHHGDLKRALLDAAVELIRTTGAEALTLREVARRAGVSHNAPYRHFRDKAELLSAVATEGYNYLSDSVDRAMSSGKTAYERFQLSGEGFLRFALLYPDHFKLIFDSPRRYVYPETLEAGERTFGKLISGVEQCQAEGLLQDGNPRAIALMFLGVAIGVAKLAITSRLPFADDAGMVAFDQSVKAALFRGLAPQPDGNRAAIKRAGKKTVAGPKKSARL